MRRHLNESRRRIRRIRRKTAALPPDLKDLKETIKNNLGDNDGILQYLEESKVRIKVLQNNYQEEKETSPLFKCFDWAVANENLNASVVLRLIEMGGEKLVMETNEYGESLLTRIITKCNRLLDVVYKLIEIGGRDLVTKQDMSGKNALHLAIYHGAPIDVMLKLIELGRQELVLAAELEMNFSPLHLIVYHRENHILQLFDVVLKLILEMGGKEILEMKDAQNSTATQIACEIFFDGNDNYFDLMVLLVSQGILLQVGGEFSLGGIFSDPDFYMIPTDKNSVDPNLYGYIDPFLKSAIASIKNEHPPLLHAALMNNIHESIVEEIINEYGDWCLWMRDSLGRLPIDVAIEIRTPWDSGMRVLLEVISCEKERSVLFLAAHHGLQFTNYMKELAESSELLLADEHDDETGLDVFMVAASSDHYDLDSIYGLLRMCPEALNKYTTVHKEDEEKRYT